MTTECKVKPQLTIFQWNSMLMPTLCIIPNAMVEHLPVVVGSTLELKLFGVPSWQKTEKKTGDVITDLMLEIVPIIL